MKRVLSITLTFDDEHTNATADIEFYDVFQFTGHRSDHIRQRQVFLYDSMTPTTNPSGRTFSDAMRDVLRDVVKETHCRHRDTPECVLTDHPAGASWRGARHRK